MMDKSTHTITVPREYVEYLEQLVESFVVTDEPIAKVREVIVPNTINERTRALFIQERDGIDSKVEYVIIVNSEGKELGVFKNTHLARP